MRRALPQAPNGPRFRIARVLVVGNEKRITVFGEEDTPSDAQRRVFAETGRVMAIDRRGYIYVDNHEPIQERN